jgi:hypothetical protein
METSPRDRNALTSLTNVDLQQRIVGSYIAMRVGIGVMGIVFPLLLLFGGLAVGICAQGSMSAYYYAASPSEVSMRNWFVGLLFVVSISLGLYRGFSRLEDILLDVAAVFGVGIAIFPMDWDPDKVKCGAVGVLKLAGHRVGGISLHGICAVAFFLCIALVCWLCSGDTLSLIKDQTRRTRLKIIYRTIGILMPASMLAAWALNTLAKTSWAGFWTEAAGIFAFGAYWLVKSKELKDTEADGKALRGQLRRYSGHVEELAPEQPSEPH